MFRLKARIFFSLRLRYLCQTSVTSLIWILSPGHHDLCITVKYLTSQWKSLRIYRKKWNLLKFRCGSHFRHPSPPRECKDNLVYRYLGDGHFLLKGTPWCSSFKELIAMLMTNSLKDVKEIWIWARFWENFDFQSSYEKREVKITLQTLYFLKANDI